MTTRVKAVLHGVGEAPASTNELMKGSGNLLDASPLTPDWSILSGEGHAAFVAATLAQAPGVAPRRATVKEVRGRRRGRARHCESGRSGPAAGGARLYRARRWRTPCRSRTPAADDGHVGFPKLQDPPPLDPPAEQYRVPNARGGVPPPPQGEIALASVLHGASNALRLKLGLRVTPAQNNRSEDQKASLINATPSV